MSSPSGFNPMGTGPEGFVPDPQSHAPNQPTNTLTPPKGKIKPTDLSDDLKDKPWNDRFENFFKEKWPAVRTAYVIYHQLVWQGLLYYVGQLWIQWDKTRRVYQPAEPEDDYTPQPEINYYAPAADAVASLFSIPPAEAVPKKYTNDDAHDVAEVANVLAQEFDNRNGLDCTSTVDGISVSDRASQLFVQAGNMFGFVRKRRTGMIEKPIIDSIPMMGVRCVNCDTISKTTPDDPMLQPPPPPPPSPSDMLMGQQVSGLPQGGGQVGASGAGQPQPGQPPYQPPCPTCNNPLDVYPTTEQRMRTDPLTQQPVTTQTVQWDAEFILGNPLYGLPRPGSKSLKDLQYFMWAERQTIDSVFEELGYEANPDNQYLDSMESSWEIALNYYYTGFTNMTEESKDSCLVLRMYIEPGKCKRVPEGGVGVIVNDKLIDLKTWNDACAGGESQLLHACYLDVPVTFFGRSVMFDIASHQKELNRYESIIALNAMTQASDTVLVDENTKVSELTGRGDRIAYWRSIGPGSQPPHRMTHGSLDAGVYEQRQKLLDNIQNVTGAVSVMRGEQAGSVNSASGISQLRGQAEQTFSKPVKNWNNFWAQTRRKGVKVMQQVMTVEQISAILGKNNSVIKAQKFKNASLDELLDWKAGGKGLPRTRDERKDEMLALFDRQMLDVSDPNVQEEIGELFGDTGLKTMFNKDATRARWENGKLRQGEPVQFMPDVEDLNVHLFIHAEEIKDLDFDTRPDNVKKLLLEHYMATKMAATQLMMMQMEMAQGAGEGGGGGEGAVGPGSGPASADAAAGSPSGPGAPSGGHHAGPGEKGGPSKGTPGAAGGRISQTAGQRRVGKSQTPTGPPKVQ